MQVCPYTVHITRSSLLSGRDRQPCEDLWQGLRVMLGSKFCLQPPGDVSAHPGEGVVPRAGLGSFLVCGSSGESCSRLVAGLRETLKAVQYCSQHRPKNGIWRFGRTLSVEEKRDWGQAGKSLNRQNKRSVPPQQTMWHFARATTLLRPVLHRLGC